MMKSFNMYLNESDDFISDKTYVFIIDSVEEFKNIQQKLFDLGIYWCTGNKKISVTAEELEMDDEPGYPLYVILNKNNNEFFYRDSDDLAEYVVYKKYSLYNFDYVLNIKPSYKPKKFNKSYENLNEEIHFRSNEEIIKYINNYKDTPNVNFNIGDKVELDMINIRKTYGNGGFNYNLEYYESLNLDKNIEVVQKYYSISNEWWSRLDSNFIKKTGDEFWIKDKHLKMNIPSYKPKKFNRTLESITYNSNIYNFLSFKLNDKKEFIDIQNKLFKLDIVWPGFEKNLITDTSYRESPDSVSELNYPLYVFIDLYRNRFFFREHDKLDEHDVINTLKNICSTARISPMSREFCEIVFNLSDFHKIFNSKPSYLPKKFNRSYENLNESIYFYDNVRITEYINRYNVPSVNFKIGDKIELDIINIRKKYFVRYANFNYELHNYESLNLDNDIQIVEKFYGDRWWSRLDSNFTREFGDFWITDEFILSKRPSYLPKKFNRSYENLNESPDNFRYNGKNYGVRTRNAFAFEVKINRKDEIKNVMINPAPGYHTDFEETTGEKDRIYPGRIYIDQKIITFWSYPTREQLDIIIPIMERKLNLKIWNNEWLIEVYFDENGNIFDLGDKSITPKYDRYNGTNRFIPIEEFSGSLNISEEERDEHTKSPLFKKKKEVPSTFGSNRYSSKLPLIKRQELFTEGVNNSDYMDYYIYCDTREKSLACEDFLHTMGYIWSGGVKYLVGKYSDINNLTISNIDFINKTFDGYDSKQYFTDKKLLLYPENKQQINSILKYNMIRPNYNPKKFNKTYESFQKLNEADFIFFQDNDNIEKYDYKPRFKIDDKVIIKKDGHLIHKDNIYFHEIDEVLEWFKNNELKDTIIKEMAYERDAKKWYAYILINTRGEWIISDALISNKPNYKPKKFNKNL